MKKPKSTSKPVSYKKPRSTRVKKGYFGKSMRGHLKRISPK
jgi:hypothetical protein